MKIMIDFMCYDKLLVHMIVLMYNKQLMRDNYGN